MKTGSSKGVNFPATYVYFVFSIWDTMFMSVDSDVHNLVLNRYNFAMLNVIEGVSTIIGNDHRLCWVYCIVFPIGVLLEGRHHPMMFLSCLR